MNVILIILVAIPFAVVLMNAALNRAARRWSSLPGPHTTPFVTGALVNGTAVPLLTFASAQPGDGIADTLFGSLYALSYVNCVVFLNWFVFSVTDVSMHVHLLVEIHRHGTIRPEELHALYNKSAIIEARLPRLLELRQLRLEDGRLYVRGSAVLLGARLLVPLRRILGIPPRPQDAQDPATAH